MAESIDNIMRSRSPSVQAKDHLESFAEGFARGDQAKFDAVDDFVKRVGGDTVIRKVLIANNGIGAVKCIRSIRKWSFGLFGDERKIQFVVMATPEDMNANAEYIRMADEIVEVPNGTNNRNYANVVLIVGIAEQHECDAVWAGWGHASENPALPNALEAVKSRNIVFIGPPAGPMGALGDKIGSTIIAQSASVPTIAWNGDGLQTNYGELGRIPQEIYDKANVTSVAQAIETCAKVGFPLMIKASEGGGGKGIRKVLKPEDVELCFHQVQGEIPGSPIFIMKLAPDARHLEVQLLADKYGEAIALSGRDCSVQRRHQKIIEEGPPLAPTPQVWAEMQAAAVRLAKEVGYINAGTVEYLFMPDGTFAFLELNPRLQVEHPVTEMITGVNLPACQLMVAMGIPLGRIPQIRKLYGYEPFGDKPVVFQKPAAEGADPHSGELVSCDVQGHVIACRITAENPDQGFQPTSGAIQELNFRSTRNVWGYFSVDSSGQVHEYADSQIGHLFAWGANRELARENMVQALKECSIRGEIQTTVEYLIDILQTPEFRDYEVNTAWLDKRIEGNVRVDRGNHLQLAILTAAVQAYRKCEALNQEFVDFLDRGQIPSSSMLTVKFPVPLIYEGVKYGFETFLMSSNVVVVSINGSSTEVRIRKLSDGGMLLVLGARSHTAYAKDVSAGLRMVIDGKTCLFAKEYDPSHLRAEMAGKLTRFLAEDGALLKAGDPYAEVEVMKMFLSLKAPEDGVLHHACTEGRVLSDGDLVARLELTDPSKVKTSKPFDERIPATWLMKPHGRGTRGASSVKPHVLLRELVEGTLNDVVSGYEVPRVRVDAALRALPEVLNDPQLPFGELQEALSFLTGRLPPALQNPLSDLLRQLDALKDSNLHTCIAIEEISPRSGSSGSIPENQNPFTLTFPEDELPQSWALLAKLPSLIEDGKRIHLASIPEADRSRAEATLDAALEPLQQLASRYSRGFRHRFFLELAPVLKAYIDVEKVYNQHNFQVEAAIQSIRSRHSDNLQAVYEVALSHARLISKNQLVLKVLALIPLEMENMDTWASSGATAGPPTVDDGGSSNSAETGFLRMLEQFTLLDKGNEYKAVALAARQKLISSQLPSIKKLRTHIIECLRGGSRIGGAAVLNARHISVQGQREAAAQQIDWLMDHNTDDLMEVLLDLATAPTEEDTALFQGAEQGNAPSANKAAVDALKRIALEVYAMRVYRSYGIRDLGEIDLDALVDRGVGASVLLHLVGSAKEAAVSDIQSTAVPMTMTRSSSDTSLSGLGARSRVLSGSSRSGPGEHQDATEKSSEISAALFVSVLSSTGLGSLVAVLDALNRKFQVDRSSPSGATRARPVGVGGNPFGGRLHNQRQSAGPLGSMPSAGGLLTAAIPQSVLHVLLPPANALYEAGTEPVDTSDAELSRQLYAYICSISDKLRAANIRRITFVQSGIHGAAGPATSFDVRNIQPSKLFTFRNSIDFREDQLLRHIEPPMAHHLELQRLSNYNITMLDTSNRVVRAYHATPKPTGDRSSARGPSAFFVRVLVRRLEVRNSSTNGSGGSSPRKNSKVVVGAERYLLQAMNALENPVATTSGGAGISSHIFLNVLSPLRIGAASVAAEVRRLFSRFQSRLARLRVVQVEIKLQIQKQVSEDPSPTSEAESSKGIVSLRLIAENPTGFKLRVDAYVEQKSAKQKGNVLHSISNFAEKGSLDGELVNTPYPVAQRIQQKRAFAAMASSTCYVYDFIDILECALRDQIWKGHSNPPHKVLEATELVLGDDGRLWEVSRPIGENTIGMVAWIVKLYTPQFPPRTGGREVVIVANDITTLVGSFGTREDLLFQKVTAYARRRGVPRLYFAANSGARIGLAKEVKSCFKVAWVNPADPTKGFKYIYVSPEDYEKLSSQGSIIAERVVVDQHQHEGSGSTSDSEGGSAPEIHYRITSIIGKDRDLGVENLQGSGAIAGESARAYNDIFTLTYVCGRSVGIGAYLVRLNQRTIQRREMAPIILTGYAALNKLVGRKVYTSNSQLGGPGIMYTNGVSHMTVDNDLEGMVAVLKWLSFVPRVRGEVLPIMETSDHVNRQVQVQLPTDEAYDPRVLLAGHSSDSTAASATFDAEAQADSTPRNWVAGFCDRGSFVETLGGWAKTVVTGRARLGGIPIGIIATESRTVSKTIPADPASPASGETTTTQPGGVWFPDSAAKTAQAIRDLNTEELPLFIFANWRGFSGGQRDMYDEVLKFGSDIVTALVDYKQPVFVYIPPEAQLRGGAWVVVDSTINSRVMEMYAAPSARGGVLEPAGAVSIKYRPKDVKQTAHRIDTHLLALKQQGQAAAKGSREAEQVASQIFAREELVSSIYQQVALKFASLHDTPQRMLTKGVIHGIVPLHRARHFFFWRLQRKLREFELLRQIQKADPGLTWDAAQDTLMGWFANAHRDEHTLRHSIARGSSRDHEAELKSDGAGSGDAKSSSEGAGSKSTDAVIHSIDQYGNPAHGEFLVENVWLTGDEYVVGWFQRQAHALARHIGALRYKHIVAQVQQLGLSSPHDSFSDEVECGGEGAAQAVIEGVLALVQSLPDEERGRAIARLRRDIVFMDLPSNSDAPTGALRPLDSPDTRARSHFHP